MSANSTSSSSTLLQFSPFSLFPSPSFWNSLSTLQLDDLRLSDEPIPVIAAYDVGRWVLDRATGKEVSMGCRLGIEGEGLKGKQSSLPGPSSGTLRLYHTLPAFTSSSKTEIISSSAQSLLNEILTSEDPIPSLTKFELLVYADLKKWKFWYWNAVPALVVNPGWEIDVDDQSHGGASIEERSWKKAESLIGKDQLNSLAAQLSDRRASSSSAAFCLVRMDQSPENVMTSDIMNFEGFFKDVPEEKRFVCFIDPSSNPHVPGWPLRNLLSLLLLRFKVKRVNVIAWKDELGGAGAGESRTRIASIKLGKETESGEAKRVVLEGESSPLPLSASASDPKIPSAVGWERNSAGKLGPKLVDLGNSMDPRSLADQAVDLNLKLMRWRLMPEIKLEKIQSTKCLLLGAGTLGCYVARGLLGWGVRNITFLDNSKVSFSNPVRQPLFEFEDCLEGGKPKAQCAADGLKKIWPGVNSTGHQLSIPMPGHPIPASQVESVKKDVQRLEELISQHDVVYLLMDSRESRWLPTVIGAKLGKLVLNAALGFDTYLVMRHGAPPTPAEMSADFSKMPDRDQSVDKRPPGERRLGCYFCNDVVAPSDSLTDRTLDQMCTVTRPGLAAIAGASAVELMVSVIQHELGVNAPASSGSNQPAATPTSSTIAASNNPSTVLGLIPHQIRGFLSTFSSLSIIGQSYDRCTACSPRILETFQRQGFEMLTKVFNEEGELEKITGLDKLKEEAERLEREMEAMELEEGSWGGSQEGEGELL